MRGFRAANRWTEENPKWGKIVEDVDLWLRRNEFQQRVWWSKIILKLLCLVFNSCCDNEAEWCRDEQESIEFARMNEGIGLRFCNGQHWRASNLRGFALGWGLVVYHLLNTFTIRTERQSVHAIKMMNRSADYVFFFIALAASLKPWNCQSQLGELRWL